MQREDLLGWVDEQALLMEERLMAWSNINSGTQNLPGLSHMAETIRHDYQSSLGEFSFIRLNPFNTLNSKGEWTSQEVGQGLHCRIDNGADFGILLCGHMDTVFGVDHRFQEAVKTGPDEINGPGVTDMKGGLLIMLTAVSALMQTTYGREINWDILINPDEEIGSPSSLPWIMEVARHHDVGLVFEPAITMGGNLVNSRKGSGKFTLVAQGKAAHAGRDFSEGRNAIVGLAECVADIDRLNGQREGLTINVGKIQGGEALNIVPDHAMAYLDVRTLHIEDESWCREQLTNIISAHQDKRQIHFDLEGGFGRPPKTVSPRSQRLFEAVSDCASELNIPLGWQPSGGCCDGNNLSAAGLAVIDSLGAKGNYIHTENEMIIVSSLVERAKLTTLLLLRLASDKALQKTLKKD